MEEIKKERKYKGKIILIFLLILLGLGTYGYFWYSNITKTNIQAKLVLSENAKLKTELQNQIDLKDAINSEKIRCQEFISQKEGDFGDFEYCKNFIDWANEQNIK